MEDLSPTKYDNITLTVLLLSCLVFTIWGAAFGINFHSIVYLQMDELACFAPGMIALGSFGYSAAEDSQKFLSLAEEVYFDSLFNLINPYVLVLLIDWVLVLICQFTYALHTYTSFVIFFCLGFAMLIWKQLLGIKSWCYHFHLYVIMYDLGQISMHFQSLF